jgi:hypothetical protein
MSRALPTALAQAFGWLIAHLSLARLLVHLGAVPLRLAFWRADGRVGGWFGARMVLRGE